jgi:hypothetical protein
MNGLLRVNGRIGGNMVDRYVFVSIHQFFRHRPENKAIPTTFSLDPRSVAINWPECNRWVAVSFVV